MLHQVRTIRTPSHIVRQEAVRILRANRVKVAMICVPLLSVRRHVFPGRKLQRLGEIAQRNVKRLRERVPGKQLAHKLAICEIPY